MGAVGWSGSQLPARVGIEMGGTKCVCTLGTGPDDIRAQQVFPTRDPQTTLASVSELIDYWWATSGNPRV